jgi:hypothetical protein
MGGRNPRQADSVFPRTQQVVFWEVQNWKLIYWTIDYYEKEKLQWVTIWK